MANVPLGIDLDGCYSGDPESIGNAVRILTNAVSSRQEAAPDIITPRIIVPASMGDDFEIVAEDGTIIYPPQWQSYTPELTTSGTAPSVGTGATQQGFYMVIGRICHFYARIILGSGFSFGTGNLNLSLPLTGVWNANNRYPVKVGFLDSATPYDGLGRYHNSSGVLLQVATISGSYITGTTPSSTVPFTWAAGDSIYVSGSYPI